jgi:hypothetical protein
LPHNIVIGSVGLRVPSQRVPPTGHRCARLRRACGQAFRLRCSGAVELLDGCSLRACAFTQGHTLCSAVLTTETHQILCDQYPPGTPRARHAPVARGIRSTSPIRVRRAGLGVRRFVSQFQRLLTLTPSSVANCFRLFFISRRCLSIRAPKHSGRFVNKKATSRDSLPLGLPRAGSSNGLQPR